MQRCLAALIAGRTSAFVSMQLFALPLPLHGIPQLQM